MLALRPSTGAVVAVAPDDLRCSLHELIGCSWLVEDAGADPDGRCRSCRLTQVTPPLDDDAARAVWADTERAKRRLVHECLALGLPIEQVRFEMLTGRIEPVVIGHADGLITIDVDEADDAHRTQMREQLSEPYRTMLGHLRHESGHALLTALVHDAGTTDAFRELFGDETASYQDAVDRHYAQGPPAGWQDAYVSAYATMHPHEDWAESFAHYIHLRATLETAERAGIVPSHLLASWRDAPGELEAPGDLRGKASVLLDRWVRLTVSLNAVNRAMGHDDLYPFVLSAPAAAKLAFVHDAMTR